MRMTQEQETALYDQPDLGIENESWDIGDEWIDRLAEYEPVEEVDPYLYVMGLDPGGTTGVAMLRIDTTDDKVKPELIYLHQIVDGRYGFKEWFEGSTIADNVIVVSEQWVERHIKGADREPIYIEGGMHMLWGEENVEWQTPDKKELIPDEWLKKNNLWTEGKRHQMDALKHAFAYLRNQEHSATLDSLSGKDEEAMAQPGEAQAAQITDGADAGAEASEGEAEGAGTAEAEASEGRGTVEVEIAQADEPGDDSEGRGPGNGGIVGNGEVDDDKKNRTKRSRNGAFAGYNPPEYESGGVTLLDD